MIWRCITALTAAALAVFGWSAEADVQVSTLFSNNVVLQQGMAVPVWGWASAGERVAVKLQGQEVSTTAGQDGRWMVRLAPLAAGGPFSMTISGRNTVVVKDVLVGEVWVCSGQSNIDVSLVQSLDGPQVCSQARDYQMRWMQVPRWSSDKREERLDATWKVIRPSVVGDMSAVGYYFARDLRKALGVPVGIIQGGLGGTRCEWWTGRPALESSPFFAKMLETDAKDPHRGHEHPSALYNTMIAPLQPFAIRGVVWYQGESNERDAYSYRIAFPTLIKSWRDDWGQGQFPFLFVQIAPYMKISEQPEDGEWAVVRESQLITWKHTPNTAMVVTTDVGDQWEIHPKAKEPVGARLALAARALAYGEKTAYSGPIYSTMKTRAGAITLRFDYTGSGLVAKDGALTGFAIAGEDRKFVWADARIAGDKIVVSSPSVPKPVAVRYGWANCPVVNLYNREGLPASPFRTDDWPVVTQPQ